MPATAPQLVMCRPDMEALPPPCLAPGYVLRAYREGEGAAWERLLQASFAEPFPPGSFDRIMRSDPAFAAERILFVCRESEPSQPIGTASAWHRPAYGAAAGYLHYVAVVPGHTGLHLGREVSLACLRLMRGEGRTSAVLQTDDFRLPAIRTYLGLGFRPQLEEAVQGERWRRVFEAMKRPELSAQFREVLES